MEAGVGATQVQARNTRMAGSTRSWQRQEGPCPRAIRGSPALRTPWLWTSSFQNNGMNISDFVTSRPRRRTPPETSAPITCVFSHLAAGHCARGMGDSVFPSFACSAGREDCRRSAQPTATLPLSEISSQTPSLHRSSPGSLQFPDLGLVLPHRPPCCYLGSPSLGPTLF